MRMITWMCGQGPGLRWGAGHRQLNNIRLLQIEANPVHSQQ
jgi:hypothetical protein